MSSKPYSDNKPYKDNFEIGDDDIEDYNNIHSLPTPDEIKIDHARHGTGTGLSMSDMKNLKVDMEIDLDDEHDHHVHSMYRARNRCYYYWIGFLCILLVCMFTIILSVSLSWKYKARPSRVNDVINYLSDDFALRATLMDEGTPQYLAAKWIADTDQRYVDIPASAEYDDAYKFIQRYALAVFYYSLNAQNWIISYDFLSEKDECQWNHLFKTSDTQTGNDSHFKTGVRCNDDSEVIDLFLPGNKLAGSLPDELSLLQALERVALYSNQITGSLPPRMQYLTDLNYLALETNKLEGTVPDWLGSLTNLTHLALGDNKFTGTLPSALNKLQALKEIAFENNELAGDNVDELFNSMPNLRRLYLQSNNFTGHIGHSFLVGAINLDELDLSDNQFTGYISHRFLDLTILDLSYNALTGTIPDPEYDTIPIQYLMLHNNQLTGSIPTEIAKLKSITHLDVSRNYLSGRLPTQLGDMTSLRYLYLGDNDFTKGRIPDLSYLTHLHQLSLTNTGRTGYIPNWLGESRNMASGLSLLDLSNNYLKGPIPESMGGLTHLKFLLLNRNYLTGNLPTQMNQMKQLQMTLLDHNDLKGNSDPLCAADGPQDLNILTADCIKGLGTSASSTLKMNEESPFTCSCCKLCCAKGDQSCNDNEVLSNEKLSWKDGYSLHEVIFSEDIMFMPNQQYQTSILNQDNGGR